MLKQLVLVLSFLTFALALTKPESDSWYSCPSGYAAKLEGTILKSRKITTKLRSVVVPISTKGVWQLMVRSTDSHGTANCIVTTVIEPYNADPTKLLSYQIAEDASYGNCALSYAIQTGASADTLLSSAEMLFILLALERGWYVVVPDYEGLKSAFTAGLQAGHATLDSVRAVLQSSTITGVLSDAKVAMWGYSGGSLASTWAAQLQPAYAPELADLFIGAAVGGWVTNITAVAAAVDGTVFAGLVPMAINGLFNEYPKLETYFLTRFTNVLQQYRFLKADSYCAITSYIYYVLNSFFSGLTKYVSAGWSSLSDSYVQLVLSENTLALNSSSAVPTMPLMVYHGVLDEIVPYSSVTRAYKQYCANGIGSLELNAASSTGHITEIIGGASAALVWLEERFAGNETTVTGCQLTTRVSNLLYPGVNQTVGTIIQTALDTALGTDFGPNAENVDIISLFESWV